jgi:ribonuclease-3
MNRLNSLHNKTQEVKEEELPYNPSNTLLQKEDLREFFNANGLGDAQWHNLNIYRNAFVHRSYCTMKNADFETGNDRCPADCLPLQEMSYERLEFLGDAILGMIVARYLYERYPDQNEGFLSKMRTKLVNGKMLGHLAKEIGFPKFAIISKQIEESQGRDNYKTMEDIFEAFIGAIYMDFQDDPVQMTGDAIRRMEPFTGAGYHMAEVWVITILERLLDFAELVQSKTNYKEMIVRYMQHALQDAPSFFEISVDMRSGKKVFNYCVKDRKGSVIGTATGPSKKDAENNAARAALIHYRQSVD